MERFSHVGMAAQLVDTVKGERRAWIVTPHRRIEVGRRRLEAYQDGYPGADLDHEILVHARNCEDEHQLIVFQGRDGASGSWGFSSELSQEESEELGYHLVIDQLPLFRRLVAAGVYALLHVDFGQREVQSYEKGLERALRELEANSIPEVGARNVDHIATGRIDRWILMHLCRFYTAPLSDVLSDVIYKTMPALEDRVDHLRDLVAELPEAAIQ